MILEDVVDKYIREYEPGAATELFLNRISNDEYLEQVLLHFGVLEEYVKSVVDSSSYEVLSRNRHSPVSSAFIWNRTPSGSRFWSVVNSFYKYGDKVIIRDMVQELKETLIANWDIHSVRFSGEDMSRNFGKRFRDMDLIVPGVLGEGGENVTVNITRFGEVIVRNGNGTKIIPEFLLMEL